MRACVRAWGGGLECMQCACMCVCVSACVRMNHIRYFRSSEGGVQICVECVCVCVCGNEPHSLFSKQASMMERYKQVLSAIQLY